MKQVLLFGAGLVAGPLVDYLLNKGNCKVTVADLIVSKAEALIKGHSNGVPVGFDITKDDNLDELVRSADIAISLLPYTHHVTVAEACLREGKHLVTASYVSEAMAALDDKAKEAGLLFLNESGLDPGIDHMSAMRIIDTIHDKGGNVLSFHSYTGGLPAPEANTNPWGYKLSWSPRGVALAGRNTARYQKDGGEINIPSVDLFAHTWPVDVPGAGTFDAYPNRDSVPYIETYGIPEVQTMFRGTFRYPGWCATWKKLVDINFLSLDELDLKNNPMTYEELMRKQAGIVDEEELRPALALILGIPADSDILDRWEWLGLFSSESIPLDTPTCLDALTGLMQDKLVYEEGEQDMIVMYHEFLAEYPKEHTREKISSTLIAFGEPDGYSSMAKTVGLPAAIAARMILEGKITSTGVHIPVKPDIYNPILNELAEQGVVFKEYINQLEL